MYWHRGFHDFVLHPARELILYLKEKNIESSRNVESSNKGCGCHNQMRVLFMRVKLFWILDVFDESHSHQNVQILEISEWTTG